MKFNSRAAKLNVTGVNNTEEEENTSDRWQGREEQLTIHTQQRLDISDKQILLLL